MPPASSSREVGAMGTRVTIAGHPIHAMLVNIPIGLWIFTLTSDVVFAVTGDPRWEATALFTLAGGIAGALLAAVPGLLICSVSSPPMHGASASFTCP